MLICMKDGKLAVDSSGPGAFQEEPIIRTADGAVGVFIGALEISGIARRWFAGSIQADRQADFAFGFYTRSTEFEGGVERIVECLWLEPDGQAWHWISGRGTALPIDMPSAKGPTWASYFARGVMAAGGSAESAVTLAAKMLDEVAGPVHVAEPWRYTQPPVPPEPTLEMPEKPSPEWSHLTESFVSVESRAFPPGTSILHDLGLLP